MDSNWSYAVRTLTDPNGLDSAWHYAAFTLDDPGKPNLVVSGQETEVSWQVMKDGVSTPVVRWTVMKNGSETPLVSQN